MSLYQARTIIVIWRFRKTADYHDFFIEITSTFKLNFNHLQNNILTIFLNSFLRCFLTSGDRLIFSHERAAKISPSYYKSLLSLNATADCKHLMRDLLFCCLHATGLSWSLKLLMKVLTFLISYKNFFMWRCLFFCFVLSFCLQSLTRPSVKTNELENLFEQYGSKGNLSM